jgi:signal transduction histidine kinase
VSGQAAPLAAVAWVGWAFALAATWTLRRRMERVADAEHELRGAATAIRLVAEASPGLRLQLDRMEAALADLAEARGTEPPPAADLEAGRLAQVLGNVIDNAAEHGVGAVEVRNRDRSLRTGHGKGGRGLAIAKRAARELGGRVSVESENGFTRAVIELPQREADDSAREGRRRRA